MSALELVGIREQVGEELKRSDSGLRNLHETALLPRMADRSHFQIHGPGVKWGLAETLLACK
jgi:hypothetical protein